MILPDKAHFQATKILLEVLDHPIGFRDVHTVPIHQAQWDSYSSLFVRSVRLLGAAVDATPLEGESFDTVRAWAEQVAHAYARAMVTLAPLSPFLLFDHDLAVEIQCNLRDAIAGSRDAAGRKSGPDAVSEKLEALLCKWVAIPHGMETSPLQLAFGLLKEPLDSNGDFQAAAVLSTYRYDNGRLMRQILPHLQSFGVPAIPDLLVCVSIVGWLVRAEDPVLAYVSFRDLLTALVDADDQVVRDNVLAHFRDQEGAMRQTRSRIHSALDRIDPNDLESVALSAADVYKRVVESGVRQYGWTFACLADGKWESPPTLGPVRQRMVALGGLVRSVAERCALTELRNGEAHENIEWDGIAECFRVGELSIDLAEVVRAITIGTSFELGSASAVACLRAIYLVEGSGFPSESEQYRMPAWHRAESYFGTNGLLLVKSDFNRPQARIVLESFDAGDVNPCFQALIVARQLMPRPLSFEVRAVDSIHPIIVVDVESLDETHTLWKKAVATFTTMPFSTFLPANLAARRLIETDSTALKSVCWIAADDVLDAFDSSRRTRNLWPSEVVDLFEARLHFARLSLDHCCNLPDVDGDPDVALLKRTIDSIATELAAARSTDGLLDPTRLTSIELVRGFWDDWGPTPRFPGVVAETTRIDMWPLRLKTEKDRARIGSI